jgi:hypothetical protein
MLIYSTYLNNKKNHTLTFNQISAFKKMNVYLTNSNNNDSNDNLEEAYSELYLIYSGIFCLLIVFTLSIIMCLFPIQCGLALTILLLISKLLITRKDITFFEKEYDLDVFPEDLNAGKY